MSVVGFSAVVPLGGVAGYNALQKTATQQQKRLQNSPLVKREVAYFQSKVDAVTKAADLTSNSRLLSFFLTAYNLGDQASYKGLAQKVLTSDLSDSSSTANRLSDKRWLSAAQEFKYLDATSISVMRAAALGGSATKVDSVWKTTVSNTVTFKAVVASAATLSDDTAAWKSITGSKSVLQVFQQALNLPAAFLTADASAQQTQLQTALQSKFGSNTLSQFSDATKITTLQNAYLDSAVKVGKASFKTDVVNNYLATQWQDAVQTADTDVGLAVYFQKRIGQVAQMSSVDKSGWYTVIAEKPLRSVFQAAFGLSDAFWQQDVDKQVGLLQKYSKQKFGSSSLKVFTDATKVTKALNTYLYQAQVTNTQNTVPSAVSVLTYQPSDGTLDLSSLYSTLTMSNGGVYSASLLNIKV